MSDFSIVADIIGDLNIRYGIKNIFDIRKLAARCDGKQRNTWQLRKLLEQLNMCLQMELMQNVVAPAIFNCYKEEPVIKTYIEIGFILLDLVKLENFEIEQGNKFYEEVKKYIDVVIKAHEENNPNWPKLWMFIVKVLGVKLHFMPKLTKKLLGVTNIDCSKFQEKIFSVLKCWFVLIDNWALDSAYITSKIQRILAPVKDRMHNRPEIETKQFDVFVYLLKKLKSNCRLCITEFLCFCFGPFSPTPTNKYESTLYIDEKSTKIFMEIMGVVNKNDERILELDKPWVDLQNFNTFMVLKSVWECCALAEKVYSSKQHKNIVNSLWAAIFRLLDEYIKRQKSDESINFFCRNLELILNKNPRTDQAVLQCLVKKALTVNFTKYKEYKTIVFEYGLTEFVEYASEQTDDFSEILEVLKNYIDKCLESAQAEVFYEILINFYSNMEKWKYQHPDELAVWWLKCEPPIADLSKFIRFLLWPMFHCGCLQTSSFYQRLTKLFNDHGENEPMLSAFYLELEEILHNSLQGIRFMDHNTQLDHFNYGARVLVVLLTTNSHLNRYPDRIVNVLVTALLTLDSINSKDLYIQKIASNIKPLFDKKDYSCLEKLELLFQKFAGSDQKLLSENFLPIIESLMDVKETTSIVERLVVLIGDQRLLKMKNSVLDKEKVSNDNTLDKNVKSKGKENVQVDGVAKESTPPQKVSEIPEKQVKEKSPSNQVIRRLSCSADRETIRTAEVIQNEGVGRGRKRRRPGNDSVKESPAVEKSVSKYTLRNNDTPALSNQQATCSGVSYRSSSFCNIEQAPKLQKGRSCDSSSSTNPELTPVIKEEDLRQFGVAFDSKLLQKVEVRLLSTPSLHFD